MTPPPRPRSVLLLSGGLDSATAGAMARARGDELFAMSFDYGQRHHAELEAAGRVAAFLGVKRHMVMRIDLCAIGGSALTADLAVPKDRAPEGMARGIPVTYVPARNTVFLSLALGWAETLDAGTLVIGVNALDYSGYPDCRPEFLRAFEQTANMATRAGVEGGRRFEVFAPLLHMSKAQIVAEGARLGIDFSITHSCYDPPREGFHCGRCDSCLLRKKGFREAGIVDPTRYATDHGSQ
ncbi:MAG: 7-cyano-7-deazaguanine synthase QueC [Planctomycetes bacterium]|nr:7-cyano-7-deazaguanine synthase QueC [Planctomycetota bacterium]